MAEDMLLTNDGTSEFFARYTRTLSSVTDDIGKGLSEKLNSLLKLRLQASGIKQRTGKLFRSIRVDYRVIGNAIEFSVGTVIYGVFNSFGVGPGVRRGKVYRVPDWIRDDLNGPVQGGDKFSYRASYRKYGIPARKWLPDDEALKLIIDDFFGEYSKLVS